MVKLAKRIQKIREGVDPTKLVALTEAISMVKVRAVAKFDGNRRNLDEPRS